MKYLLKFLLVIILTLPSTLFAQNQTANIGLIKGIWFSQTKFFAGDTIRIYTALQNNSGFDVDGTIEFFDNGKTLGSKPFSALDNRIIESWVDMVATVGKHEYSIKIIDAQKNIIGEAVTPINPQATSTETVVVVERDTDGDDIPDSEDTDDDNDGYTDIEEKQTGTNPLDAEDNPKAQENIKDTNNSESPKTNATSSTIPTYLEDLLQNIIQKNTEPTDGTDSPTGTQNTVIGNDVYTQSPEIIQKLTEQNKTLVSIITAITAAQVKGEDIVLQQQKKISSANSNTIKNTKTSPDDIKDIKEHTKDSQTNKTLNSSKNILVHVYDLILTFLSWLFSVWWFWLVFPFFIIYLLIKLLFKIFGRK